MNDPTAGALFPGYPREPSEPHLTDFLTDVRCLLTVENTASCRLQSVLVSAIHVHETGRKTTAPWLERPALLGSPPPIAVELSHKVLYAGERPCFDRHATYLPARR